MSSTNIRYKIFPQMEHYDKMSSGEFCPYAMLSGPKNYCSSHINTDSFGFRKTIINNQSYRVDSLKNYKSVNLIVGGSTVFGVGSSSDRTTIASELSSLSNEIWLNFGIRGANSFQEFIHLINILNDSNRVNNIVFLSGINDLYMSLVNDELNNFDNGFGSKFNKISAYHPYHQSFAIFFSNLYNIDVNKIIKMRKLKMLFSIFNSSNKEYDKLSFEKRIEVFSKIYSRNFKLYKGLKESFNIGKITFILQPLIDWTNKKLSTDELKVLEYLNSIQRNSPWEIFKKNLNDQMLKIKLTENLNYYANKNNIAFEDSNNYFKNINEDCFVDSVHLNDKGYEVLSKKIIKMI